MIAYRGEKNAVIYGANLTPVADACLLLDGWHIQGLQPTQHRFGPYESVDQAARAFLSEDHS